MYVEPWRAVAERHGFRLLGTRSSAGEYVEHLLSGATFLDLAGVAEGFSTATLRTWIETEDRRWSLTSFGVAIPRPRPRGAAGWIAANLVVPAMQRLVPRADRPVEMRSPAELSGVIEKHLGELLAVGGKPVKFEGNPLEARREQERRDQSASL